MSDLSRKLKLLAQVADEEKKRISLPKVTTSTKCAAARKLERWLVSTEGQEVLRLLGELDSYIVLVGSQSGAMVKIGYCLGSKGLFKGTEHRLQANETSPKRERDYSITAYEVVEVAWSFDEVHPDNFLPTVIAKVEGWANSYLRN